MSGRCGFGIVCRLSLLLVAGAWLTASVEAADRFWITSAGGGFNSTTNWSASDGGAGGATVPTTTDVANFTLNNTYDVTFNAAVTNTDLDIENGNVTFDLNGNTYTGTSVNPIEVGKVANQTGRLTVTDGTVAVNIVGASVQVGTAADSTGFLTIGTGGQLGAAAPRPDVRVGNSGTGTLTIQNNGKAFTTFLVIGSGSGSSGTATVTGHQASLDASSNIIVGNSGNGTLTVSAGANLAGSASAIGSSAGTTGTVTVTGAGSQWTQTGAITVGSSGVGTLNVQSGGTLATNTGTLGDNSDGVGTANVSGTGSEWTLQNTLFVGSQGEGLLNVSGGGHVSSTADLNIGNISGAQGSVVISGTDSRLDAAAGIAVGNFGAGSLTISSGGQVISGGSIIAEGSTSVGEVTITGAGSSWNVSSGTLAVASAGAGTLTVEKDANLSVASTLTIGDPAGTPVGTLNLDGGTIETNGFTRLGTLNLNDGTLHVKGIYDHGAASAALVIDGPASGDLPTLRLSGNAAVNHVTTITVGNSHAAALVLDSGRVVNTGVNNIAIGAGGLGSGTVTLSGAGTSLTTTGILAVGGSGGTAGGAGILNIDSGSSVSATTLNLFAEGSVNLNGGTLTMLTFNANGGSVNFTSGTLVLTAATVGNAQLDAILGAGHILGAGRTLTNTVVSGLTLGAPLNVNGGAFTTNFQLINDSLLQVNDGVVQAGLSFTNNAGRLLTISGAGSVISNSGGITNNGTIQLNNNLVPTSGTTLTNSGTIRGSGFIGNNLTNNAAGQVQVTTGNRIEFQGATNTNSGSISLVGGEVVFTGAVTNSANTGLISGRDAILRTGGITNNGSLAFTAGQMDVYGEITNNVGGRITVSGGGTTTFYDDVTIAGGASNVQATAVGNSVSSVVFFGSYNGGVTGGGTAFLEGDHRPGNSPALVAFGGDAAYGGLARLFIEIGGASRGNQYDAVDAAGAVALGGALDVTLLGGFTPNAGDTFAIISAAGGITGTFADESLPTLYGGLFFDVLYAPNTVSLVAAGVLGDYNYSGTVDAADYTVWRNMLGQAGSGLAADGDGDGGVDPDDFAVWKSHFGESSGSGAAASSDSVQNVAVPEPAAIALALVPALVIGLFGRRHSATYRAPQGCAS